MQLPEHSAHLSDCNFIIRMLTCCTKTHIRLWLLALRPTPSLGRNILLTLIYNILGSAENAGVENEGVE